MYMAAKICQLASIKIVIEQYLNYFSAKIHSFLQKVKVKVQVFYSLISSLKTYHRTILFTPWSLDLLIYLPFQLPGEHTAQQPFRRIELIVHIAISVLPGTHCSSEVK